MILNNEVILVTQPIWGILRVFVLEDVTDQANSRSEPGQELFS